MVVDFQRISNEGAVDRHLVENYVHSTIGNVTEIA